MAKVKITGHASGSGVVTVTAPNTSTDRTITLPDATGTLLNSDGSGAALTGIDAATVSTTAPSSPAQGDMWFDSTSSVKAMKVYSGTEWNIMSNLPFSATGGTESTYSSGGISYKVHTFTSSGTFTTLASGTVDVLMVGGGGSGGSTH